MLPALARGAARGAVASAPRRAASSISFDGGDVEVAELIDRSLVKGRRRAEDNAPPARVLTTRRESLALYREIWRVTALFEWPDDRGRPWRDVLRASAREEFEAARAERDPEVVARLLVVGRDAVHQAAERFLAKRGELAGAGGAPGAPPGAPPTPKF